MNPKARDVLLPVSISILPTTVLSLPRRAASVTQATSSVVGSVSLKLNVAVALRVATTALEKLLY